MTDAQGVEVRRCAAEEGAALLALCSIVRYVKTLAR